VCGVGVQAWSQNGDKCWVGGFAKFSPDGWYFESPTAIPWFKLMHSLIYHLPKHVRMHILWLDPLYKEREMKKVEEYRWYLLSSSSWNVSVSMILTYSCPFCLLFLSLSLLCVVLHSFWSIIKTFGNNNKLPHCESIFDSHTGCEEDGSFPGQREYFTCKHGVAKSVSYCKQSASHRPND
jgi:hypothetical protein